MSKSLLPMFSSRSFIDLGLTFRSLIHSELILYMVWDESNFILLFVFIQFSQHQLLKILSILHWVVLASLLKIIWPYIWVYFWTLSSIPLVYLSVFMPVPEYFIYCSFVIYFEIRKCETCNLVLLFQNYFGYLGSLEI